MAASNNRNHEYFEDLLGAYALDALNDEERAELDEHLAGCDPCRAELAELSATVADLAFLTEEIEPSAGLRGRIRQNALNAPKSTSAEPTSIDDYRSRLLPWGMAAVFLIAALGLLAWNLQLRQDSPEQAVEMIVLRPAGEPTGDAGVAYYMPEEQVLVVVPRVLPELGPGEVYQVWLIDDGGPIPAGVLTGAGQRVAIAADRAAYQAVAVTIEPGPLGSPLPTTEPFIVTPLESS